MNASLQADRLWLRLALLVFAVGVFAYRDNIMDDTWIHLQYAANLRTHGELAFNSGEPSLGLTSPLWVLLLALLGSSEIAARLASVASGALSVWVFAVVARRVLGRGPYATAATLVWAANVWLVRHAPNGMESTLAVLLVLVALEIHLRPGHSTVRGLAFGTTLGAALLARPEVALLAGLFVLDGLRSVPGRRSMRVWVPACALVAGAWFVFAWTQTGSVLAHTASAKSGAAGDLGAAFHVFTRELRIVAAAHGVELVGLATAVVWALRIEGRRAFRLLGGSRVLVYAAFATGLVGLFAVLDVQVQPRYLLPVLPAVTLAGFAAWRTVLGGGSRGAALLALLCVALNVTVSAVRVLPPTRAFARGLRPAMAELVAELDVVASASSHVATPDIGYIGYHAKVRVVDLGGLIDTEMRALRERVGDVELVRGGVFLERGPVEFVVDRSLERERFAGHVTRELHWRPLRTTTIPNLGISRPGPYYYTLYALESNEPTPSDP